MDNRNACAEKQGTWAGYQRHYRAGEKPCAECQQASRDYQNTRNGSRGSYCKGGCGRRATHLCRECRGDLTRQTECAFCRSEEHTSELQSRGHLVCRLLLEKKKKKNRSGEGLKSR